MEQLNENYAEIFFLFIVCIALILNPFVIQSLLADSFDDNSRSLGATYPQLAFDGRGNAVAVWFEVDGKSSVWARHYDVVSGWGIAYCISAANSKVSTSPVVTIDSDGNAIAAWAVWQGKSTILQVNRFRVRSGYGRPVFISRGEIANNAKVFQYAFVNKIVADSKGNAFVL